jgi:hypothetical protein
MPPRSVTLAIIACWLAASGWLFYRDIWPDLKPGERPPFTIDLSKEALGAKSGTHWTLHRSGQRIGSANTMTRYVAADGCYELINAIHFEKFKHHVKLPERKVLLMTLPRVDLELEVRRMKNVYRVTQDGDLLAIKADIDIYYRSEGVDTPVLIQVKGQVEDGVFRSEWSGRSTAPLLSGLLDDLKLTPDPIEVRSHNSMFNPMMPWNRLLNVREKQQWRMALFDPLSDSLTSFVPGMKTGLKFLDAGVLEGSQDLFWDGKQTYCLVIEYRDPQTEAVVARTWVRQSDGLVLRQEATRGEDRMVLEREPK